MEQSNEGNRLFCNECNIYAIYERLFFFVAHGRVSDGSMNSDKTTTTVISGNATTNRKLLNKQSKNISTYRFDSEDIPVDGYGTARLATTKSVSTQTGSVGVVGKPERQITRPKTAKINR